ncbi:MAG: hypothetical protein AAF525_22100, partial [Pseudomonadota bacterium]
GVASIGEQVIYPTIVRMGHRMIDTLVVSHNDDDHVGGLTTLANRIPVAQTFRAGCDDKVWRMGRVELQLLSSGNHYRQRNDSSCALMVSTRGFRMLIPGDVEARGEDFLRAQLPGKVSVMISPHHGSRTSSSPGFLNHFMPEVVVISAGYANRFGHPHPEILDRYRHRGMIIYNTAEHGAIDIRVDTEGRYEVHSARHNSDRPWY